MKNKLKFTSIVLSITLLSSLMVGCGNSNTSDSSTVDTSSQAESTQSSESTDDEWKAGTKIPPALAGGVSDGPTYDVKAKGFEYNYDELEYELVFEDNFDGDALNTDNWGFDLGGSGWGNNELQYYTEGDNLTVVDGYLTIQTRKEEHEGMDYTSTRLISKNKQDFLYGRIEVNAKLPSGRGTWPAIWMLPTDWEYGGWPESGEIDIMEHVGYDQDKIHGTIHTEAYNHSKGTDKGKAHVLEGASEEFNTYFIEWLPDVIYFGVNDIVYNEYRPTDYVSNPSFKHWPFDKRMHILINVAVGGFWGGAEGIDDDIFPQEMVVDYVKVYQSPQITGIEGNL